MELDALCWSRQWEYGSSEESHKTRNTDASSLLCDLSIQYESGVISLKGGDAS